MEKVPYVNPQDVRRNKRKAKKKKKKETRRLSPEEIIDEDERDVEIEENKDKKRKPRKTTDKSVETSCEVNEKSMTEAEADAVRQKLWPSRPNKSDRVLSEAKSLNLSAEAVPADAELTAKDYKVEAQKQRVQFPLEESPLKLKLDHIKRLIVDMAIVKEKHEEISKKLDEWCTKYDGRLQALEASVQSSQKKARNELEDINEGLSELEKLAKKNQQQRKKLQGNLRIYYGQEATQSVRGYINQKLINLLCSLLLYIAVLRDHMTGKPGQDKMSDQPETQNLPVANLGL